MFAVIYLALAFCLGDFLCRRFYRFVSVAHRCAAAVLVGILVSSWFTYLVGLTLAWTSRPLLWANLLFFAAAIATLVWGPRQRKSAPTAADSAIYNTRAQLYLPRAKGSSSADWLLILGYVVLVSWMMFASFNSTDTKLKISNPEYSDFGPNTAIIQSFAVGHNFPTEYPHFSGDRIRYHFLFYFQAGNLEFLGLNPAWSLNLLSISTLVAMLILVMVLGEVVFNSRTVGRLGSFLFFFFGSLSYIPFLQKLGSVRAAILAIKQRSEFLPTIFPYRGEQWGTWSQVTFINQRHFASAIGLFLLVLIFLIICYRAARPKHTKLGRSIRHLINDVGASLHRSARAFLPLTSQRHPPSLGSGVAGSSETLPEEAAVATTPPAYEMAYGEITPPEPNGLSKNAATTMSDNPPRIDEPFQSHTETAPVSLTTEVEQKPVATPEPFRATLPPFIYSAVLLGLLPMWNSAVFIAAAVVLGMLFLLFPLRRQMLVLAIVAGVIALPQMLYLSSGSGRAQMPRLLHWGYTIDQPTAANVLKYLGFTFGFKWVLIALALLFATSLQRRLFLAVASLVAVAFCFQFTVETLANQKFLHMWVIIINLFVAFALWRLWRFSFLGTTVPTRFVAIALFLLVIPGGVIDLFPIHNTGWSEVTYRNDPLIQWLKKETTPQDIFLTDRFVNHPILMAGRRVFYGWPYYGWSAGYNAAKRDRAYIDLFEIRDPWKLFHLLKENHIRYVAFDGAVRSAQFIKRPNEQVYATYFPKVYENSNYNGLVIYKIPDTPPAKLVSLPEGVSNMFEGGRGTGKGEFDSPAGIAIDNTGNILVTDTSNSRIEKFSADGAFQSIIGAKGAGQGQLGQPNGIAVDRTGNIYVADAGNHRVDKLAADGTFISELKPTDVGFYGPRRIAIGPDDSIYVVDQGHTRIVKFSPEGRVLATWGSKGAGDGQFNDHTSVAVDRRTNKVYVADPINKRIQVFDSTGRFLTKWTVAEWGRPYGFEDLAIDPNMGRLYASSANMDMVLTFDLNGTRIGSVMPKAPDRLDGPSALALANRKLYVLNMHGSRVSEIDL